MIQFDGFYVDSIQSKDYWNLCNLMIANEDRFKRYMPKTLEQNLTPDLSKIFTETKVKQHKNNEEFLFTIKENNTNDLVGLVYIKDLDWNKKQAELAYCIGYQHKGNGIVTQAVTVLSEYAFEKLELKTLQIIVHKANIGSVKVAERCGYLWIKTLTHEFTPPNEQAIDMELYELYNKG